MTPSAPASNNSRQTLIDETPPPTKIGSSEAFLTASTSIGVTDCCAPLPASRYIPGNPRYFAAKLNVIKISKFPRGIGSVWVKYCVLVCTPPASIRYAQGTQGKLYSV